MSEPIKLTDEKIQNMLRCIFTGSIHTDREMPIDEALEYMTDDWIDAGEYCNSTLIDTRNACIKARAKMAALEAENQRLRELLRDIEYCIPHESEGTAVFLCPFCQSEEGLPHSEKCHYTDSTD